MKARNLRESFRYAGTGIAQAFESERNIKIHVGAAIAVGAIALVMRVRPVEAVVVVIAATSVIVAEMINTALERCIDLVSPEYHPLAAKVKNIAAGAVLIATIGAVIVGIVILGPYVVREYLSLRGR